MGLTVNFKVRILRILFAQVIDKLLRMNASINLESLTALPQHRKILYN